jgi:hypothetical protein
MTPPPSPPRAERFSYGRLEIDEQAGELRCHYRLDDFELVEVVFVRPGASWTEQVYEVARLVHLLAGVSYYKAGAPPVVDLGMLQVRPAERELLRAFYLGGLGEFAHRNGLVLDGIEFVGGREAPAPSVLPADGPARSAPERPLLPFGGGIDSIVSFDALERAGSDVALFVLSRRGLPFEAIEKAAVVTGRPILRAERELDPALLAGPGSHPALRFNGHVPITGILSAIAVLVALLEGRDGVVMSNEWSASQPNLVDSAGHPVNHQYSKGAEFEDGFRQVLSAAVGRAVDYFSLLRPFSELWVARRFARLERFHSVVHSCNRAFHLEGSQRLGQWCGQCDKCCFIDLVLAPFLDREASSAIFGGSEPLDDLAQLPRFRALLGLADRKPFECVGDVHECRTAAVLAAERPDRAGQLVPAALVDELGAEARPAAADAARLLGPLGPHHIPDALVASASLL